MYAIRSYYGQYSTGGKPRLGRISKQGDSYLRTLLIHGARAVIRTCKDKEDKLSLWVKSLLARVGFAKTAVALAAKNARIVWAILTKETEFKIEIVTSYVITSYSIHYTKLYDF